MYNIRKQEIPSLCTTADIVPPSILLIIHHSLIIHVFLRGWDIDNTQMLTELESIWAYVNEIILVEF